MYLDIVVEGSTSSGFRKDLTKDHRNYGIGFAPAYPTDKSEVYKVFLELAKLPVETSYICITIKECNVEQVL